MSSHLSSDRGGSLLQMCERSCRALWVSVLYHDRYDRVNMSAHCMLYITCQCMSNTTDSAADQDNNHGHSSRARRQQAAVDSIQVCKVQSDINRKGYLRIQACAVCRSRDGLNTTCASSVAVNMQTYTQCAAYKTMQAALSIKCVSLCCSAIHIIIVRGHCCNVA